MEDLAENPSCSNIESLVIHTGYYLHDNTASTLNWSLLKDVSNYFFNQRAESPDKFGVEPSKGISFLDEIGRLYSNLESLNIARKDKDYLSLPQLALSVGSMYIEIAKKINSYSRNLATIALLNHFLSNF